MTVVGVLTVLVLLEPLTLVELLVACGDRMKPMVHSVPQVLDENVLFFVNLLEFLLFSLKSVPLHDHLVGLLPPELLSDTESISSSLLFFLFLLLELSLKLDPRVLISHLDLELPLVLIVGTGSPL
jgi:hypothetical protein